eukprot:364152-Chlamydomonas_euryale.AAC.11
MYMCWLLGLSAAGVLQPSVLQARMWQQIAALLTNLWCAALHMRASACCAGIVDCCSNQTAQVYNLRNVNSEHHVQLARCQQHRKTSGDARACDDRARSRQNECKGLSERQLDQASRAISLLSDAAFNYEPCLPPHFRRRDPMVRA